MEDLWAALSDQNLAALEAGREDGEVCGGKVSPCREEGREVKEGTDYCTMDGAEVEDMVEDFPEEDLEDLEVEQGMEVWAGLPGMAVQPVVVVHHTIVQQDHYLLPFLSTQFRVVPASNTDPSSLVFPTFPTSCLLLDCCTPASLSQHLEQCLAFLKSNTGPFILLTPAKAHYCHSPIQCSQLGLQLILALQGHVCGAMVLSAPTPSLALGTILQLLEPSTTIGRGWRLQKVRSSPGSCLQRPWLVLAGTLCRDRVNAVILIIDSDASTDSLPVNIRSALQNVEVIEE